MIKKNVSSLFTMAQFSFGQQISGLELFGRPAPYPVMNERAVRATAGLMLVAATLAFSLAYFNKFFIPIKVVTVVFFFDFLIRLFAGLTPLSPFGVLGSFLVRSQEPEWVGAAQKRFAWSLGLIMALAMSLITNFNIRGALPFTICMICISLMWMESALGLCLGCKIYLLLIKTNIVTNPEHAPICAGDSCATSVNRE